MPVVLTAAAVAIWGVDRRGPVVREVVRSTPLEVSSAEWHWLHPLDGRDPAESQPGFQETFMQPEFDDSDWQRGPGGRYDEAIFGYGDDDPDLIDIGTPPGGPALCRLLSSPLRDGGTPRPCPSSLLP